VFKKALQMKREALVKNESPANELADGSDAGETNGGVLRQSGALQS
jgi:hypothetical protein